MNTIHSSQQSDIHREDAKIAKELALRSLRLRGEVYCDLFIQSYSYFHFRFKDLI